MISEGFMSAFGNGFAPLKILNAIYHGNKDTYPNVEFWSVLV
jgi:hypothetical protein